MTAAVPTVSIGVPVYNGMPYLPEAVAGLRAQTLDDPEIVISDNASTDSTAEFCESAAREDPRIRFFRNAINLGASANYNRTFLLSRGRYFKWAAADDVCLPNLVRECVRILDRDPDVVLCYPRTRVIDATGSWLRDYPDGMHAVSELPEYRFEQAVRRLREANAVFGVMRAHALRQTGLIGAYPSSDLVLLGEMALRGKLWELREPLFLRRDHPSQSMRAFPTGRARSAWFDPKHSRGGLFPTWRVLREYIRAIDRAPLDGIQRRRCRKKLWWWVRNQYLEMAREVVGFIALPFCVAPKIQ